MRGEEEGRRERKSLTLMESVCRAYICWNWKKKRGGERGEGREGRGEKGEGERGERGRGNRGEG